MSGAMKFLEKKVGPVTVGLLIRAHRTRHDLSQADLADKLGVTIGFISNVCHSLKSLKFLKRIFDTIAFHCIIKLQK